MARTVRNAKLDTRSARTRLKPRREPYWTAIQPGCALGYRRGTAGGTWIGRHYDATAKPALRYSALGTADDALDADGVTALSFAQAQAKARAWFAEQAHKAAGVEPMQTGPYTVADAIRDYLKWYARRGGRSIKATERAANVHILPALGTADVARLTTKQVRDWHEGVAATPARLRSKRGGPVRFREASTDADVLRRRRATANRVLAVLKAALNYAWHERKAATDEAWRRVKPFRNVDSPVVRYLTEKECVRIVNACAADFRPMVRAALLTGCRYGELAALRVADFNPDSGTLTVRTSKSGKARHVVLTDEGKTLFAQATAGRASPDHIFARPDGAPWGYNHQLRPLAEACKRAKINPAISFHILRHTHGSTLAMRGVPMPVIARQLGHADTRMTEKHYAHLSPNYVADTIRANFPKLGVVEQSNVEQIA